MTITVHQLSKSFNPGTPVVDQVSFVVRPGEMFFLLGPSGCGKTTVLRMLAGFVAPDTGDILFDQRRMNDIPAQRRNTAMVFQNYAIWPHLSVYENIAYGPRAQKLERSVVDERVSQAIRVARLENLSQRKPSQLSGGQQQRVALARALAVQPDLILLDEPLSNLDARLRLELRDELARIHRETRISYVYVTHDQEEALSLADRLAVMNQGKIEQIGSPAEIYQQPINEFVARFMGEINILPAGHPLLSQLSVNSGRKTGFRPEAIYLTEKGISATVKQVTYLGSKTEIQVEVADGTILKLWTPTPLPIGAVLHFQVPPEALLPL